MVLSCRDAVAAESGSGAATGSAQSLLQVLFQFGEFPVNESDLLVKRCIREKGRLKECDHEFGPCPKNRQKHFGFFTGLKITKRYNYPSQEEKLHIVVGLIRVGKIC